MSRKRIAAFIMMYVVIILSVLFVYLFVQKEYGADPSRPYQRRFFIRLPMLERVDSRFAETGFSGFEPISMQSAPVNGQG